MNHYNPELLLERMYEKISHHSIQFKNTLSKPQIVRANTKIIIKNFKNVCDSVSRDVEHVKEFISSQLNINTSLGLQQELIIPKPYPPIQIMGCIEKYIKIFVQCPEPCSSLKTSLIKSGKIFYMICDKCKSKRSVVDCDKINF
jgi:translation initiation factor 2 subunit 2